jgi:phenylacetate-CoA ligase
VSAYAHLFERVVFRAWEEGVRGRPTLRHRALLERSQWWSPHELRAWQAGALRRLIAHAHAHVPYYGEVMRARSVDPSSIAGPEDLARLPLLTKAAARVAPELRRATAPPLADIRKLTGGTTGEPLSFGFDRGSEYWRHAVKFRGWAWAGYRVGERAFYYWGPAQTATPPWQRRAQIALDRMSKRERYVDCTIRGEAELAAAATAFAAHRPEIFICYTQAGVDLARHVLAHGRRTWGDVPVLCCAERLDPLDRPLLERAFGPVFETYGCREVMLIATECEAHDGLHVSAENLIVELIVRDADDPDDPGRPARPGEIGEVVVTDLHNLGMPFIRYALGDLAIAGDDAPCACGRGLPRIRGVEGRTAETFRDARGAPVCGILFSRIFSWSAELAAQVRHWQAVQHVDGRLTLKVQSDAPLSAAAHADLQRSFGQYLPGLPITVEQVAEIPPGANGKRRTVVVERA